MKLMCVLKRQQITRDNDLIFAGTLVEVVGWDKDERHVLVSVDAYLKSPKEGGQVGGQLIVRIDPELLSYKEGVKEEVKQKKRVKKKERKPKKAAAATAEMVVK